MFSIFKNISDTLGSIMPRSRLKLPLYFKNKSYFASKRVTLVSIIVAGFVVWNSFKNLQQVG